MKGIVDINVIRNGKIVHEVKRKNAISNLTSGLKYKIINHMVGGTGGGNTASAIYLEPNFSFPSFTSNESSSHAVVGQNGIFADAPQLGTYTGQGGDTETDASLLFKYNQSKTEFTATKARWKAQAIWQNSDFEATISSLDGTSTFITNFYLGKSLNASLDHFDTPFSSVVLTGSDRVQPALNDIIDVTWTIEVS